MFVDYPLTLWNLGRKVKMWSSTIHLVWYHTLVTIGSAWLGCLPVFEALQCRTKWQYWIPASQTGINLLTRMEYGLSRPYVHHYLTILFRVSAQKIYKFKPTSTKWGMLGRVLWLGHRLGHAKILSSIPSRNWDFLDLANALTFVSNYQQSLSFLLRYYQLSSSLVVYSTSFGW